MVSAPATAQAQEQPPRHANLPGHFCGDDENARAHHDSHNYHGGIKEPQAALELGTSIISLLNAVSFFHRFLDQATEKGFQYVCLDV